MTLISPEVQERIVISQQQKLTPVTPVDMQRVATIILGGGQGTRLLPLTNARCKPALPFGGKYRLIDIPMSNAINSGCLKIFIVTQFLSNSLHQHISSTYRPGTIYPGFIELLSVEQKPTYKEWFQGTADAIRQNINHLAEVPVDYFLILSGDQLYNMNFQHMVRFAKETNADLVVASLPVNEKDAKRMGLLKLNEDRFITEFYEKPQTKALLDRMRMPEFTLKQVGQNVDKECQYLGSMGIYLFKRQALFDLLTKDTREDFGNHLIPTKVAQGNVAAFIHEGYWEDIGTVESFYKANMALTSANPAFDCYDQLNPIFSYNHHLPAPRIYDAQIQQSLICEGSIVEATEVSSSIIGPRSVVKKGCIIRNSYLMGNDFYHPPTQAPHLPEQFCIDENCIINHAIIDKQVWIGKDVKLINKKKLKHYDGDGVFIRDGIIIVTKNTHLPDGFIL